MKLVQKKNKINVILFLIGILILTGLFWYVGSEQVFTSISQASPFWLILSMLSVLPVYLFRAWRWKILLVPVKNQVKISSTFWSTAIGFMVNAIIPIRLGEFIRAYLLSVKEKIGFAPSVSSIVVERTLDVLGVATLGLMLLTILPSTVNIPTWYIQSYVAVIILLAIIITIIIISARHEKYMLKLFNRIINPIPFLSKRREWIIRSVKGLIDGAKAISQSPTILVKTLIPTYLIWLFQFLGIYFIFKAFNYPATPEIILFGAIIIWSTSILPAPPGNIGTYEVYWVVIFLDIGLTDTDMLLAMGLTMHLLGLITLLAIGGLGLVWFGLSFGEIIKIKKPNNP